MRKWINTNCNNEGQNECVCPRCRYRRDLEQGGLLDDEIMRERLEIIRAWDNRMDTLNNNMKKRFPSE